MTLSPRIRSSSTPRPRRRCLPSRPGGSRASCARSQARALAAADAERRRIGRDLHDTAQQRLLALRVHLSLAGEQLQPEEQPIVEQLERELDEALDELQSIARGIYPQVLARVRPCRRAALGGAERGDPDQRHGRGPAPPFLGHRARRLLLLSGSAAERRQARGAGRVGERLAVRRRRRAAVPRRGRRAGVRAGARRVRARASRTWPTGSRPSAGRSGSTRAPAAAPAWRVTSPSDGAV